MDRQNPSVDLVAPSRADDEARASEPQSSSGLFYFTPPPTDRKPKHLVPDADHQTRFTFFERLEIGRHYEGRVGRAGQLLIKDPTVSSRHCVVTQTADGRCFVRDLSRNGTRLDGCRLVPNQEVEIRIGQTLSLGLGSQFELIGEPPEVQTDTVRNAPVTQLTQVLTQATILVGDIRNYTTLVREAPSSALQQSVRRVFQKLEHEVLRHGGTIKEYQGDAVFAFWEQASGHDHAAQACRAALALDALARQIARDSLIWDLGDFSLLMDWALTTGTVLIDTYGGASPSGLSMIGEPVVLAFRLEKFADDQTGSILACPATREAADHAFEFRNLGKMQAKGFEKPDHVFALAGHREPSDRSPAWDERPLKGP